VSRAPEDASVIIEDNKSVALVSHSMESNIRDEMNTTKLEQFADQKVKRLQLKNIKIVKDMVGPTTIILSKRKLDQSTLELFNIQNTKKQKKHEEAEHITIPSQAAVCTIAELSQDCFK
jgi:hypothetical protein